MTALVFALAVVDHVALVILAYVVGAKIGGWWERGIIGTGLSGSAPRL